MSRDRAQTQQDFAVGVSIFLLATLFVFAYLPSTLASSDAEIEQQSYAADRLVASIFTNVTAEDGANQLNRTRTRRFFVGHDDSTAIRANYSLPTTMSANVTLETLQGLTVDLDAGGPTITAAAGDAYAEQVGATTTRIVRLGGTRYRLVVRVW
ncbi:DUF7287 family protein [Haloplanus halophilus]|uniref:DUF7287 family protein n=1 Tax=Haloplanus halophilus TaxID=2949993 RepID=UPI002040264B|nr:hypothetical protein [Haloplanus sp. GDY1]